MFALFKRELATFEVIPFGKTIIPKKAIKLCF